MKGWLADENVDERGPSLVGLETSLSEGLALTRILSEGLAQPRMLSHRISLTRRN